MNEPRAYDAVFFDLDGTLLPIDTDAFMQAYTSSAAAFAHEQGLDGTAVMHALFAGVKAMASHDGRRTNRDVFWDAFCTQTGLEADAVESMFARYYAGPFNDIARLAAPDPAAARAVATLKERDYPVALATMPMFPLEAVHARLRWAGLDPADFTFVTDYACAHAVKPQTSYYEEVLERAGVEAKRALMVGNNTREDGAIARLGADLFFVTDHLIDPEDGVDATQCKHGTLAEFAAFCETLPRRA